MRAYQHLALAFVHCREHICIIRRLAEFHARIGDYVLAERRRSLPVLGPEKQAGQIALDYIFRKYEDFVVHSRRKGAPQQFLRVVGRLAQGGAGRVRAYVEMVHKRQSKLVVAARGIPGLAEVPHQVQVADALYGIGAGNDLQGQFAVSLPYVVQNYVAVAYYFIYVLPVQHPAVDIFACIYLQLACRDVRVQVVGAGLQTRYHVHIPHNVFVAAAFYVLEVAVQNRGELLVRGRDHIALRLDVQIVAAGAEAEGAKYDDRTSLHCQNPRLTPSETLRVVG